MNERNLTLLTDFYELTMGNGYLENGLAGGEVVNINGLVERLVINVLAVVGLISLIEVVGNIHLTVALAEAKNGSGIRAEAVVIIDYLVVHELSSLLIHGKLRSS